MEGKQEYTLLLFIPRRAPFDLFHPGHRHGIKLYVRRVFIMDDADQLMPAYLRFVRGVIDSTDLPLNVSREILQQSADVEAIRAASVKRVLALLEDLAKNKPDDYATFWKEFGAVLKEGVGEDAPNTARIAPLLRFASTRTTGDEQTVSLSDYVARMKEGQTRIFYITADSLQAARHSPHLEVFGKIGHRGAAALRPGGRVAGVAPDRVRGQAARIGHERRPGPRSARRSQPPKQELQQEEGEYKDLLERMKAILADRAAEVRLTDRLTTSPACIVGRPSTA